MPKAKKKKIGRPNPLLYYAACIFAAPFYKLKYGMRVDRSGLKGIKGPALVIAPHISNIDHIIMAYALFPHRPTFVMSKHFMNNPLLRRILPHIHIITKKMCTNDAGAVLNIIRAIKEENIVVLFPEGRLTWYGHSLGVTEGTYDLIRKLGVDVYTVTGNGAYLSVPKWSRLKRRGKINITTSKLMSAEDIKSMSDAEIREAVDKAILHDEEKAMQGVKYRGKDMTEGLTDILWLCPVCGGVHTLEAKNGHISCTSCGLDATLDGYYRLHGAPVSSINEWYALCENSVDTSLPFASRCRVGAVDEKTGNMDPSAGEGTAEVSRQGFKLEGTLRGEEMNISLPYPTVKAFPITAGEHFDIYYGGKLLYVYPEDGRDTVRFAAFLEKLAKES